MQATGTFEVKMTGEPPYEEVEGVTTSRAAFEKTFAGALSATSTVEMLAQRGPNPTQATYVALERIAGALEGREGTFVVAHVGVMDGTSQRLELTIAPGSGTGELRGIAGSMTIEIVEGAHTYAVDYTIEE